jgi:hypothetical protein
MRIVHVREIYCYIIPLACYYVGGITRAPAALCASAASAGGDVGALVGDLPVLPWRRRSEQAGRRRRVLLTMTTIPI